MIVTESSDPQIMKLEAQETALGDPVLEGCLRLRGVSFLGGEPRVLCELGVFHAQNAIGA